MDTWNAVRSKHPRSLTRSRDAGGSSPPDPSASIPPESGGLTPIGVHHYANALLTSDSLFMDTWLTSAMGE